MTPTTTRGLRQLVTAMLQDLVPSEVERRDDRWYPLERRTDVSGGEIRRFFLSFVDTNDDASGVQSPDGIEVPTTMLVWTSYGSLADDEVEDLVSEDGRQIFHAMQLRGDPVFPGLVSTEWIGWDAEVDDQGRQWGAHAYTVRYFAAGTSV